MKNRNDIYVKAVFLIVLLFNVSVIKAQITSTLVDMKNETIIGASVILQTTDSIFLEACVTDTEGRFSFKKKMEKYRLIIQHISYKTKQLTITDGNLPTAIILEEKSENLKEVVVKASSPIVKVNENGGLVYNAKQIIQNRPVTNALDILDEVPGIIKANDSYAIAGAGNTNIIINGRRSSMNINELKSLLATTSASQVKSVEVNYNTPAQYGVRGASINVVMEKKRSEQLKTSGDVYTTGYLGRKYYQALGGHLDITQKCWSFDLSCGIATTNKLNKGLTDAYHNIGDKIYHINEPLSYLIDLFGQRVTGRFSYDFKNKGVLSLFYDIKHNDRKITTEAPLSFDGTEVSRNNGTIKGDEYIHIANIEYSHRNFAIGGDFVYFDYNTKQNLMEYGENASNNLLSDNIQKVKKGSIYLNNNNRIGFGTIAYGMDASYSVTNNTFNNEWSSGNLDNYDNQSEQTEKYVSAFVNWSQKLGQKATLSAGVTAQYFNAHMKNNSDSYTMWNRCNIFPTMNFRYNMTKTRSLLFTLSTERTYPQYNCTSEARRYENSYNVTIGNPNLKPTSSYEIHLNHIWKNRYIAGLYASLISDDIIDYGYMEPDKLQKSKSWFNADYTNKYGIIGIIPYTWSSAFKTQLNMDFFYLNQKGKLKDISFNTKKISGTVSLSNNVTLNNSKTLALQLSGIYRLPRSSYICNAEGFWYASGGVSWNPKNSGWSVILKATDIFNTIKSRVTYRYRSQNMYIDNDKDLRQVTLNVHYVFNSFKQKKMRVVDTSRLGL